MKVKLVLVEKLSLAPAVCRRIKSGYRYFNDIVYHNFSWCESAKRRRELDKRAHAINYRIKLKDDVRFLHYFK